MHLEPPGRGFARGEVVAGRYLIVAHIARGGAGEVFEAEDLALGGRVALKTIRSDREIGAEAIERFKREIQLARQVTHPNVCRLYDLGRHPGASGQDVLFLTMELLGGPTLEERLRREGPMTESEALPLVRQMVAGLAAAHRVGVVHRDFKSANVMLVPETAEPGGLRAVVTDFGLARGDVRAGDPRLTREHRMVGTPAYMAPEQVRGEDATTASDVYALGIVLYEMVTEATPFETESGISTAIRRLTQAPPSPRRRRPDLDPRWERTILRCLEREPERRFASVDEVVAALDPALVASDGRRAWLLPLAITLGLTLAALGVFWFVFDRVDAYHSRSGASPPADAEAVAARPAVAVLDFENRSGSAEVDWLSTALSEMLAMEVGAGERLRIVSGTDVARVLQELEPGPPPAADDVERLAPVAERLGADLLVVGSYLVAGPGDEAQVRLDVTLADADGRVLATVSERAPQQRVLDLVETVGAALRDAAGVDGVRPRELDAARAGQPIGAEAARLYAEGVEMLHLRQWQAALDKLGRAVELEPSSPLLHSALSDAWSSLGYRRQGAEKARRAMELAGDLSARDRAEVEARWHLLEGRRERAAELYGELWRESTDDPDLGLAYVSLLASLERPDAARAVLDVLRQLPASAALAPRLALADAELAAVRADFRAQQAAAADGVRAARALGARLLEAAALRAEADAWRALGEPERALAAYEDARSIYEAADHRGDSARIVVEEAKVLRHQGRLDQARALAEEARTVAADIGDQRTLKHALNTLGVIQRQQGNLLSALEIHRIELETARRIDSRFGEQVTMTSIAAVEHELGRSEQALRRFSEALARARQASNQRSIALNASRLGEIYFEQARIGEAEALFREALTLHERSASRRGRAFELTNLGAIARERGELEEARRLFDEGLDIRRSIGERTNAAHSLVALGELDLLDGAPARAASRFGEAAQELAAQGVNARMQDVRALRGLALATAGDLDAGRRLTLEARQALAESPSVRMRLRVDLAAARVAALAGAHDEARQLFAEVVDEARRVGDKLLALEARLGAARLDGVAGEPVGEPEAVDADPAQGPPGDSETARGDAAGRLAALAEEAESLGLQRLAAAARAAAP
ncbi:MAG: protein kinase [Acidobacteriota bacterium]